MNKLLAIAAAAEGLTGLALLIWPAPTTRLLFGAGVTGTGVAASRMAGVALMALTVACWPSSANDRALAGLMTYNLVAAAYLAYLGINGEWVGILLWPATAFHSGISAALATTWFKGFQITKSTREGNE